MQPVQRVGLSSPFRCARYTAKGIIQAAHVFLNESKKAPAKGQLRYVYCNCRNFQPQNRKFRLFLTFFVSCTTKTLKQRPKLCKYKFVFDIILNWILYRRKKEKQIAKRMKGERRVTCSKCCEVNAEWSMDLALLHRFKSAHTWPLKSHSLLTTALYFPFLSLSPFSILPLHLFKKFSKDSIIWKGSFPCCATPFKCHSKHCYTDSWHWWPAQSGFFPHHPGCHDTEIIIDQPQTTNDSSQWCSGSHLFYAKLCLIS